MTGHAGGGRRQPGLRAGLDTGVAIAAIDSEFAGVVLVAEGDRLRGTKICRGDVIRSRKTDDAHGAAAEQRQAADQEQSQPGVGRWRKYLGHSGTRPARLRLSRNPIPATGQSFRIWNPRSVYGIGSGRSRGDRWMIRQASTTSDPISRAEALPGSLRAWPVRARGAAADAADLSPIDAACEPGRPAVAQRQCPRARSYAQRRICSASIAPRRRITDSYGWVDRDHGVVRIPVARAMERLLQKGLPGWPSQ